MGNYVALLVVLLTIIVFGCTVENVPASQSNTKIANPASQYCIDQGFNLTIQTASDGSQTGYCVFPNGNVCEEWQFYRGECQNE
jgi:putative hemolysin